MPRKNSVKKFVAGGYYHIYNRGVEKRKIFLDERDYKTFLYFLRQYLLPINFLENSDISLHERSIIKKKSLSEEVALLCYCLMPNHFHFLVKQEKEDGITKLSRAVFTNYSMYFNKRYEREGRLFEGSYKATLVENDNYLLHVSRYIHLNPFELVGKKFDKLVEYSYSSYADYLGLRDSKWLKSKKDLMDFFEGQSSYRRFVEDHQKEIEKTEEFNKLLLDYEG